MPWTFCNRWRKLINLYKIGYSLRMASDKVGKMQPQLLLNIKLEELALHLFNCSEFSWAKASSIYRAMRLSWDFADAFLHPSTPLPPPSSTLSWPRHEDYQSLIMPEFARLSVIRMLTWNRHRLYKSAKMNESLETLPQIWQLLLETDEWSHAAWSAWLVTLRAKINSI